MNPDEKEEETSLDEKLEFIQPDLKTAWRHSVRVLNACQNSGLSDTAVEMALIVAALSQVREYCESMLEGTKAQRYST